MNSTINNRSILFQLFKVFLVLLAREITKKRSQLLNNKRKGTEAGSPVKQTIVF